MAHHIHVHVHKLHPYMHKLGEGMGTFWLRLVFQPVFIIVLLLLFLRGTLRKPWLIVGNAVETIKAIAWVITWDMREPPEPTE